MGRARAGYSKKCSRNLLPVAELKYAFNRDHRSEFQVVPMCQVLDVAPSGYFTWHRRPKSRRQQANETLVEKSHAVHEASRYIYGSPRITQASQAEGELCGHNRVARLLQAHGIRVKAPRAFRRPSPIPRCGSRPTYWRRIFTRVLTTRPGCRISPTSGRARAGCMCVSRWIYFGYTIGWAMEAYRTKALVRQAFAMACQRTQLGRG